MLNVFKQLLMHVIPIRGSWSGYEDSVRRAFDDTEESISDGLENKLSSVARDVSSASGDYSFNYQSFFLFVKHTSGV